MARDDDLIVRSVARQTFSDESFKVADESGLVVAAHIGGWSELSWHPKLVRIFGPDLKWGNVQHRWDDLSADLRRTVLRDLRDALITIVNPSVYRADFNRAIADAAGRPESEWPVQFRTAIRKHADRYEVRRIVLDSPAFEIEQVLLEEDGVFIAPREGAELEGASILSDLEAKLGNTHNARMFSVRSAAAFHELLDPSARSDAFARLYDTRYMSPRRFRAELLAESEQIQRVFDDGNRPSVTAINDLKDILRQGLDVTSMRLVDIERVPATAAIEATSHSYPQLQAADLAAGYARTLYLKLGLRVVCEEFKSVVFNGAMVRDWLQVDRPDLTRLRAK